MASEPKVPEEQGSTLARQVLYSRAAARAIPETLYAGPGTNQSCTACARPIGPEQIEYEVPISRTTSLWFHVRCHARWCALPELEIRCRQCDKLLDEYSGAVENFALAIGSYWKARGSSVFAKPLTDYRRTKQAATDLKEALLDHYATCSVRGKRDSNRASTARSA